MKKLADGNKEVVYPRLKINTILGGVCGILVSKASASHAVNGGGQDRLIKTVAETVYEWNLPENMNAFISRATIHSVSIGKGFEIRFMISDAPYSDHHIMMFLDNKKYYKDSKSAIAGIVHNEDEDISESYWKYTLLSAQYLLDHAKEMDLDKIVIVENTCCEVSNESARLPRSIKSVHAQVIGFNSRTLLEIDESQLSPDNLAQERNLWKNISKNFVFELNELTDLDFSVNNHNYPQGYHLDIPLKPGEQIINLAANVNKILRTHHRAYSSIVKKYNQNEPDKKPQPSYLTLITFNKNKLVLAISPILVSFAGGLDTVGLVTKRIPDAPTIHTNGMDFRRLETGKEIKDYLESKS